jgi:hypothetical protein
MLVDYNLTPFQETSLMARKATAAPRRSTAELLDDLLPPAQPTEVEVHHNAAVLEVTDPAQLLELASDATLRGLLLCRLSPTVALVDAGRAVDLVDALRRRGHTPKVVGP